MKALNHFKLKILITYLTYRLIVEFILGLIIGILVKIICQIDLPTVYAETLIDFLPKSDPDTYHDSFDYPVTINGAEIPHTWHNNLEDTVKESQPDGNVTCEDAAYNERLSEELTNVRVDFIDGIVERVGTILTFTYPNVENIPDESIKNTTYIILKKHGNLSEWIPHTEEDLKDNYHEANLRLHIIEFALKDDIIPLVQKQILGHLSACIQIMSHAQILNIPEDKIESNLLDPEYYYKVYYKGP